MGSDSDMPVMKEAISVLEGFDIQIEVDIVSAHRTPEKLFEYGSKAHERGLKVIIAGAGGALWCGCLGLVGLVDLARLLGRLMRIFGQFSRIPGDGIPGLGF